MNYFRCKKDGKTCLVTWKWITSMGSSAYLAASSVCQYYPLTCSVTPVSISSPTNPPDAVTNLQSIITFGDTVANTSWTVPADTISFRVYINDVLSESPTNTSSEGDTFNITLDAANGDEVCVYAIGVDDSSSSATCTTVTTTAPF